MTTCHTSRRAVLAGMAALPAVSIPSTAIAAVASNPDAELVALGKEVDRLHDVWADASRRAKPHWDAFDRALKALPNRPHSNEEFAALHDKIDREFPIAWPHPDDASDAMDQPVRRLMVLPAFTARGLAAKAQNLKRQNSKLWERPFEDLDWDEMMVRNLVDAVLTYAEREANLQPA